MIFLPALFTFLAKSWILVLVTLVCLPQKLQQISSVFVLQVVSVHGLCLQSYMAKTLKSLFRHICQCFNLILGFSQKLCVSVVIHFWITVFIKQYHHCTHYSPG